MIKKQALRSTQSQEGPRAEQQKQTAQQKNGHQPLKKEQPTNIPLKSQPQKPQSQPDIKKNVTKPPKKQKEEEKAEEKPKTGLFTQMPSTKYTNIKTVDPFSNKNEKQNSFAYVYNAGGIPCRINHGSANMYLQWNQGVVLEELSFDPLLVTCFEGLIEDKHPYNFIANTASFQLLELDNAGEKVIPILNKLIWPLRQALQSSSDSVFDGALKITKQLSNAIGLNLNPHLKNVLTPIVKKIDNKKYREKIFDLLRVLEENGGPDVLKIIKATIPTYTNI